MGPLELLAIQFDGNRFSGEIVPELRKVLDKGVIRMIDLVFIRKETDGEFAVTEVDELADDDALSYGTTLDSLGGILTPEDIQVVTDALPENSSVAVLLFEHAWAEGLKSAIARAGGELLVRENIPQEALDALEEEIESEQRVRS